MCQVGGEPVAGIDHGGGQSLLAKNAAKFDAGLGIEMARIIAGVQLLLRLGSQSQTRRQPSPKFSADEDAVAGPGAGPQHRFAFGRGADHDDVGEDSVGRFGSIASGEGDAEFFRQTDQAAQRSVRPRPGASRAAKRAREKPRPARRPWRRCHSVRAPGSGGRPIPADASRGGSECLPA